MTGVPQIGVFEVEATIGPVLIATRSKISTFKRRAWAGLKHAQNAVHHLFACVCINTIVILALFSQIFPAYTHLGAGSTSRYPFLNPQCYKFVLLKNCSLAISISISLDRHSPTLLTISPRRLKAESAVAPT